MKERLTGAIILVALIVLLVPELLSGPPSVTPARAPSGRAGTAATSAGSAPVHSYTLPLGAGERIHAAAIPAVAPAQADPAAKPLATVAGAVTPNSATVRPAGPRRGRITSTPATRGAPAAPRPRTRPATKPVPPTAHPAARHTRPMQRAPARSRWVVQLGVFAVHADAMRLRKRVRARGIPVRVTTLRLGGRRLWRVRTGTVRGRSAGLALVRRVRGLGLKGELLRQ